MNIKKINGTNGNDNIIGTNGADLILAGNGNDIIRAGGGDDIVFAGNGNDQVRGAEGNDILYGDDGDDALTGGVGNDLLIGGDNKNDFDSALYHDKLNGYALDGHIFNSWTVQDTFLGDGNEGTDLLLGTEMLVFAYGTGGVALDAKQTQIANAVAANNLGKFSTLAQVKHAFQDSGIGYVSKFTDTGHFFSNSIYILELNVAPLINGININLTEDTLNANAMAAATDANPQDAGHLVYTLSGVNSQDINNIVIDSSTGVVTFTPHNDFEYLNDAAHSSTGTDLSAVLNFNILATDSLGLSSSAASSVIVTGVNDAAQITGQTSGIVFEDNVGGSDIATGTLTATDVDNPAGFQAISTATASTNGYGSFTIDASGNWTYQLDESNATVDALNNGDILSDSFIVASTDGTQQTVNLIINGHSDAPPPALLAVAYIDNIYDGVYNSNDDTLIASILDTNNSGQIDIGDTIHFGVYPEQLLVNSTAAFGIADTLITGVTTVPGNPTTVALFDANGNEIDFAKNFTSGSGDLADRFYYGTSENSVFIQDSKALLLDELQINFNGQNISQIQADTSDNVFLNVDFL